MGIHVYIYSRERETDRQTDRQRQTDSQRQSERETERENVPIKRQYRINDHLSRLTGIEGSIHRFPSTAPPPVMKTVTWPQRIANKVLYAGLLRISTTVRERRLRFRGHCWSSKNQVSGLVLWEPNHGKRSVGGQAGTVVDLLEADTRVPRD